MDTTFEKLMAPFFQLNELALISIEQITAVQLKAFQDNTRIGLYAMSTASEVKDLGSLKDYLESQAAVSQYVTDNIAIDAKEISEVGESFAANVQDVVEQTVLSD